MFNKNKYYLLKKRKIWQDPATKTEELNCYIPTEVSKKEWQDYMLVHGEHLFKLEPTHITKEKREYYADKLTEEKKAWRILYD